MANNGTHARSVGERDFAPKIVRRQKGVESIDACSLLNSDCWNSLFPFLAQLRSLASREWKEEKKKLNRTKLKWISIRFYNNPHMMFNVSFLFSIARFERICMLLWEEISEWEDCSFEADLFVPESVYFNWQLIYWCNARFGQRFSAHISTVCACVYGETATNGPSQSPIILSVHNCDLFPIWWTMEITWISSSNAENPAHLDR